MNHMFNMYNQIVPHLNNSYCLSQTEEKVSDGFINSHNLPKINNCYVQSNVYKTPNTNSAEYLLKTYDNEFVNNHNYIKSCVDSSTADCSKNDFYQTPLYSFYEEPKVNDVKSNCQTFDYNHSDVPFDYNHSDVPFDYNHIDVPYDYNHSDVPFEYDNRIVSQCLSEPTTLYSDRSQNMTEHFQKGNFSYLNHSVTSNENIIKDSYTDCSNAVNSNFEGTFNNSVSNHSNSLYQNDIGFSNETETKHSSFLEHINSSQNNQWINFKSDFKYSKNKDIPNSNNQEEIVVLQEPRLVPFNAQRFHYGGKQMAYNPFLKKKKKKKKTINPWLCLKQFPLEAVTNSFDQPKKGIPKWIIDDIKKLQKKDESQNCNDQDNFRKTTNHSDGMLPTNHIEASNHQIIKNNTDYNDMVNGLEKEPDIDVRKVINDIDNSPKTLIELIDMLDETDIENIKMTFIRESLTTVMKEVTDDMISTTVMSAFRKILIGDKKTQKNKSKSNAKRKQPKSFVTSQSLGLDVYESDEDNDSNSSTSNHDQGSNGDSDNSSTGKDQEPIPESESDD